MKVKDELHKVKVRCAHCKEIFLAETEEVSDSPAPAGAQSAPPSARPGAPRPAAASKPAFEPQASEPGGIDLDSFAPATPAAPGAAAPKAAPRVLRQKSNAPMFIVIGGGVVCVIFICLVVWLNSTKVVQLPDGTQVRMSNAEAAEWLAKQNTPENAPPIPAAAPPPTGHTGSVEDTFFSNKPPRPSTNPFEDMPPGEGPDDINAENSKRLDSQLGEMPDMYKDKIQLTKNIVYPDDQDPKIGTIALEMQNISDKKTIKTLVLSFQIMNKVNGKDRVVGNTKDVEVDYFPNKATMHTSVEYNLNAVGKYLKPVIKKFEYAPDNTVSWMVTEGLQFDPPANEVVKVIGHAKNETGVIVHDIMVYGTFFNNRSEMIGSSDPVKLDDKTTLLKDASGRFVLRFDKHGKTIEDTNTADIRVVGTKD
jgi:hypothetical protein